MSTVSERAVSEAFRRHYLATGSKSDAWNKTLNELAGPVGSRGTSAVVEVLRRIAESTATKLRDKVKHATVTLDVHGLDVWGNARDGYEVNDVYPSRGSITIPIDASHDEIVRALKHDGFVDRNVHMKSVEIDGEVEFGLDVSDRNGKPAYQLRPRHASGGGGARTRRR